MADEGAVPDAPRDAILAGEFAAGSRAAIVARDPAGAEVAMRDHITSVIDSLSNLASEQARGESASDPSPRR